MRNYILKIVLFTVLIVLINQFLGFHISRKRRLIGYYPAIRWDEFYSTKNNTLDIVFLGSSHCYRSLIPNLFDSILNTNSFNMGSSSQYPLISYYNLKEILNHQNPKLIILEVFHGTLSSPAKTEFASHNYDFYKSAINKYNLISKCDTSDIINQLLLPTYRFNNYKSLLFKSTPLEYSLDIRIIPVPREITASCGLALRINPINYSETKDILDKNKIEYTGAYLIKKIGLKKEVLDILD